MRQVPTSAARLRWFVAVAAISMVTVAGALAASDAWLEPRLLATAP